MIEIKAQIPTVNIEIAAGNRRVFEIVITADGQPYELAGQHLKMHIQTAFGDVIDGGDYLAAVGNTLTLTLPPELTADAVWRTARYDILNATASQTLMRGEIRKIDTVTT